MNESRRICMSDVTHTCECVTCVPNAGDGITGPDPGDWALNSGPATGPNKP